MSKKMTKKEFTDVLRLAGMDFNYLGYEGVLNLIALARTYTAQESKKHGCEYIAKKDIQSRDIITGVLDGRGYFDTLLD